MGYFELIQSSSCLSDSILDFLTNSNLIYSLEEIEIIYYFSVKKQKWFQYSIKDKLSKLINEQMCTLGIQSRHIKIRETFTSNSKKMNSQPKIFEVLFNDFLNNSNFVLKSKDNIKKNKNCTYKKSSKVSRSEEVANQLNNLFTHSSNEDNSIDFLTILNEFAADVIS